MQLLKHPYHIDFSDENSMKVHILGINRTTSKLVVPETALLNSELKKPGRRMRTLLQTCSAFREDAVAPVLTGRPPSPWG